MRKIWEAVLLLILLCLAAKLVLEILAPLVPLVLAILVLVGIGTFLYNRRRRW